MIPVTKAYLPNKEKYHYYVSRIFDSGWLTNRGSLLQELERRLAKHLGVKHLICVANGSLALQLAYKSLDLKSAAITTPFSFAATTSTLAWEGLTPEFADIDSSTFNLNPNSVEQAVTDKTSAIVAVHVFGNPCEVESLQDIANKHNLKVIYDAAHAFGTDYTNQAGQTESILNYGDISTISFHATKLFHTIEGGAVVTNNEYLAQKIRQMINFGISGQSAIEMVGTNAKMNEFEAAMGLCVLDEIESIKTERKRIWDTYQQELSSWVNFQQWNPKSKNNHAYAPVLFDSEGELLRAEAKLKEHHILPRRYFYPSLDTLECFNTSRQKEIRANKKSRDIAGRILCLPIYPTLTYEEQEKVINVIKSLSH